MSTTGAASHGLGKEPLDVGGIVREAGNFEYNPNIPLRYWLRTADAIQKQVRCLSCLNSAETYIVVGRIL